MLISIIIPVFNRAKMVKATLESVRRQTHRPLHLVLVDNGSQDNSLQVLQTFKSENNADNFKIDVIEEHTPGACAARNAGAQLVQSEWMMFFDSDDIMDECLVAKYVEKISQHKGELDIVTTNVDFIRNGHKFHNTYFARHKFMENHIYHACLSTQRYIVRRSVFEQSGGWNNDVKCWNDWELGIRILLQEPRITVLDGVYVHINAHDNSITGAKYSQEHERRENAISIAIQAVENSPYTQKRRVIRLLKARRFLLAGLYLQEGRKDLAATFYEQAFAEVHNDKLLRFLAPIIYRYVGMGGRGIGRLINIVVK